MIAPLAGAVGNVHHLPRVIALPPVSLARLAGPVSIRAGDPPWPPEGWTVGHREPCVGGHTSNEECDLCLGVALPLEEA